MFLDGALLGLIVGTSIGLAFNELRQANKRRKEIEKKILRESPRSKLQLVKGGKYHDSKIRRTLP